jgi:hypothetical protein
MKQQHRDIIRRFLDDDIFEMSIYSGYNGGVVLKISTLDIELTNDIQDFCNGIGVECNVKHNRNLAVYDIFCIVPDDEIYGLKHDGRFR